MVEIALCLAIIGIALVSIIGVLPIGMNTQRDNREETLVNQDATVLLEAIRGGARGLDDLTNYVYAITNIWALYDANTNIISIGTNGYSYLGSSLNGTPMVPPLPLTNGQIIVGLLSTPKYLNPSGGPIPNLILGGYSNHVVAYVHSISGPAIEKPPQTNDTVLGDSFGYQVLCVNAPVPMDVPPVWQPIAYTNGSLVYSNWMVWQATIPVNDPQFTSPGDIPGVYIPGSPTFWSQRPHDSVLAANLHELRLTFFWPQLPNGNVGSGRQTFRTLITGQIATDLLAGQFLYFYQSQAFVNIGYTNVP